MSDFLSGVSPYSHSKRDLLGFGQPSRTNWPSSLGLCDIVRHCKMTAETHLMI